MHIVQTKTAAGLNYKGLLSVPQNNSNTIILHIHGMGGSIIYNNFYALMHQKYTENGYAFLVGEHRGSEIIKFTDKGDESLLLGNAFERFEDCVDDIQGWVDFALTNGYQKIWLQAHSLGPSKVAYYLHQRKPQNIEGVIWLSPSDMLGLVHYPEMRTQHQRLIKEAKTLIKKGEENQLLSEKLWGEYLLSAGTYLNFFNNNSHAAIFNYHDGTLSDVVADISVPVLAITGTEDDGIKPVIDPKKAMMMLNSKLTKSPRVKTVVYEGAEHSFNGFEQQIVSDVLKFIKKS